MSAYSSFEQNAIYYWYRTATGANTVVQDVSAGALPYWVKLVRSGSTFTGYYAPDGVNWVQVGTTQTIPMAQNVYIGLSATSNSNTTLATVTFDNVSITTPSIPAPVITGVSATTGSHWQSSGHQRNGIWRDPKWKLRSAQRGGFNDQFVEQYLDHHHNSRGRNFGSAAGFRCPYHERQ